MQNNKYKSYENKGFKKHLVSNTSRLLYYGFPREKRKDLLEKQFYGFLKAFYTKVGNQLIMDNVPYNLGYACGKLYIEKREPAYIAHPLNEDGTVNMSGRRINWAKTRKLWRERPDLYKAIFLYQENQASDGWSYKVKWDKRGARLINDSLYSFCSCREFNIRLGGAVISGKDFFMNSKKLA